MSERYVLCQLRCSLSWLREKVYSKTRIINKSDNYILDQDHHRHTANQSINMDWQFIGELKLFEKLNLTYK